jgi:hypothetical protein
VSVARRISSAFAMPSASLAEAAMRSCALPTRRPTEPGRCLAGTPAAKVRTRAGVSRSKKGFRAVSMSISRIVPLIGTGDEDDQGSLSSEKMR